MLTIRLFGQARFERDGAAQPFRAPAKAIAMLAYLATHHDAPVARGFLAEVLWPDDDPEDGRGKVRRHLHVLAGALPEPPAGRPYVQTTMHTVRWNPDAPATIDTIAFAAAGAAGRLDEAIGWYGGDFLESFFDDWVLNERERLRNLQLAYLRAAVHRKRSDLDIGGALDHVARIFAIDPLREDALRTEMVLRAQRGDRSGALAAYRAFSTRLRAELDVDPTPETRAAYDALARGDALPPETLPALPAPASAHAPAALPFTGRRHEFAALTQAWSAAAHGAGSMVLLSGEAGAGKSRLAGELALHVESQGGSVLIGATTPGEARPYEAVVDALRGALAAIVPAHTPEELGVLAHVLPEIAARTAIVAAPASGPEAERLRIFEGVFGALARLARKRPVLLVLEDLHWTTASSAALIEYLVRRIATLPVFIVGTYRDEDVGRAHPLRGMRRRLESEGALTRIALPRFDASDVASIAQRLFPERTDIATLAGELFAYSEGVPLFLDEAVHAAGRGEAGERLNIPARIERLAEPARVLLEIAAVAGTGFNVDVLCEVAGWNEAEILRALDELVEARFVREGRRRRFGDYAFSHHLVHAAVYASIAAPARRRRHALVARASATLYADRADLAGEIARQYDLGGDAAHAAAAYATAARHARALYANDEALAHAERALALGTDPELIVDMQIVRGWTGHALGRADARSAALAALDGVAIPAQSAPEAERLRTIHAMLEGRFADARAAAERFVAAAEALHDTQAIAAAQIESATIAIVSDRYDDAHVHLTRAAALIAAGDDATQLRLMRAQTFLAQRRGAHDDELTAAADRLLAAARSAGEPQAEAEAHVRLAHVDIAAHRFSAARTHFDDAAAAYARFGSPRGIDSVQNNSANLALWMADYTGAQTLYARCYAFAEENSDEANVFGCSIGLTLAAIYTHAVAAAQEYLARVAHVVRDQQTMEEANWHLCSGLIATEGGRPGDAATAYDAALAIHRTKAPTALYALTLAFAMLAALDADAGDRARRLDDELARVPEALLSAEEFPHLMYWARSRVADTRNDGPAAARFRHAAERLYRERVATIGEHAPAFAAVPWNARFLAAGASDAFQTLAR